ncbi:MAG TPA: hypothetical protein VHM00_10380 [Caldimonas sp.]|jgi:hypothetical protein|nr:hypothetical protein [Caldimonas sp.]HEX2541475.1 hypothetical protein [Caldimonas sp.]
MSEGIKGFFAKQGLAPDASAIAAWAQRRGLAFKRERDGQGFVVEGSVDGKPWRLEWGPSQRPYIEGQELRLRMELGLPPDLLMLLLTRPLMESLEKQAFDEFTQSNQTQMGSATPEEMRWLVLFPKISLAASPALRGKFGGVSSVAEEGAAWLAGPLAGELERAAAGPLSALPPWLIMTSKGRAYLRMQAPNVDEAVIAAALDLFETACTEAIRVGGARSEASR